MRRAVTGLILASMLLAGGVIAQQKKQPEIDLQAAIRKETVDGDLKGAIDRYKKIIAANRNNHELAAKALVQLGQCYEKLGDAEAKKAYEQVLSEYADQPGPTKVARERLSALTAGGGGGGTGRTEVAMRRVWDAGKNSLVGLSPDGRYVFFIPFYRGDLWLRDLQSGEQRQITREASSAKASYAGGGAVSSPDGKWIAYTWSVKSCLEARISALDGSSMRVLHSCQKVGEHTVVSAWMPDSRRLLAVSYDETDQTCRRHMISLADGAIRDIGQPDRECMNWGYPSPDGRHIAYGLKGDIFVYDTATEQDSVLVQNPAADSMVGWTPDGSGILFLSDRSGTRDLYLLGVENGRPRGDPPLLRRNFGTGGWGLYLTRDGRLFHIENMGTSDSFIVPVDEQTGKLTGTPSLVDANYPRVTWPAWSPDGKLLYYQVYKGPPNDRTVLFIRSEETGQTREITPKPELDWTRPALSPDGRRIAVEGTDEQGNYIVFAIDSESGDVSQLVKGSAANKQTAPCANWSPDGKAIFYKVRSNGVTIRRKDLTTGEDKEVHHGLAAADMKISPDGTRFVYKRSEGATTSWVLAILDIQADKELELWRVPEADAQGLGSPAWTPDGRHVLVGRSPKQGTELWRFPAAGGPGEKVHVFPEHAAGFVMHPSGKRMAFTQDHKNYELWVLENFLPAAKAAAKK